MGFLSKFFGGDSPSSAPPSDKDTSRDDLDASSAPRANVEQQSTKTEAPRPAPPARRPPLVRVPVETVVARPLPEQPSVEPKTEAKAKAPQPPFPLPGGPKPHAPLTPPPRTPAPRAVTLIGVEAPATGRYRLLATEGEDAPPSDATTQKVIINTAALDSAPKVKPDTATLGGQRLVAPKTAVRVGARPKSMAELWDPIGEETTNPGVGAHAVVRPPRKPELPRDELKLLADFAVQLSLGPVSGLWLMEARPAVAVLKSAATDRDIAELLSALEQLEPVMLVTPAQRIDGEPRSALLAKLKPLERWLPSKDIASETSGRERLILDQLIAQISGLHPSSRRRLEDHGFASLERLRAASAELLVQELDLSPQHAEGLLAAFQSYYEERAERPPALGRGLERCVTDAVGALERSAIEFDQACDTSDSERKRNARKQRAQAIAHTNLLLAELGESELIDQMVRCSVQERVERLRQWLGTSLGSQSAM